MTIRELAATDEAAYWEYVGEFLQQDTDNPYAADIRKRLRQQPADFTAVLAAEKARLHPVRPDRVPEVHYYLFTAENKIAGQVSLRLEMTERLAETGGHIGYHVVPSCRKQGYATLLLRFALSFFWKRAEPFVIVTACMGNRGSRKVIETCGGNLIKINETEVFDEDEEGLAIYQLHLRDRELSDGCYLFDSKDPLYAAATALRETILRKPLGKTLYTTSLLREQNNHFFGLVTKGELIAVCTSFFEEETARLTSFAVAQEQQHQGYGTRLLQFALSQLQKEGAALVRVAARQTAAAFYQRVGFTPQGSPVYNSELQLFDQWLVYDYDISR